MIAHSRNIARPTEPIATNAANPPKMIHTVSIPSDSAAIPRANPPTQTTTTISRTCRTQAEFLERTRVNRLSTARCARSWIRPSPVSSSYVMTIRSVPRQTGSVTPDPAAIDESARDHVIVEGPDALTYLHSQVAQDLQQLDIGALDVDARARARPARSRSLATGDSCDGRPVRLRHRRRVRRGPGCPAEPVQDPSAGRHLGGARHVGYAVRPARDRPCRAPDGRGWASRSCPARRSRP